MTLTSAVTDMAAVSQPPSQHSHGAAPPKHVFSDDELSEIFQIDFGQIFGNPDAGRKNNYKGVQLKKSATQGKKVLPIVITKLVFLKRIYMLAFKESSNSLPVFVFV